jgi:hypothetical protein
LFQEDEVFARGWYCFSDEYPDYAVFEGSNRHDAVRHWDPDLGCGLSIGGLLRLGRGGPGIEAWQEKKRNPCGLEWIERSTKRHWHSRGEILQSIAAIDAAITRAVLA